MGTSFKDASMLPMNDGFDIPQFGIASFRNDSEDKTKSYILNRVDEGFQHFQLSDLFGNGPFIADCIFEGGAESNREKIFFTVKIWPNFQTKSDIYQRCLEFIKYSGIEYIDLCIIHCPIDIVNRVEQWKALEQLKHEGYLKSIGIANMTHTQLGDLIRNCVVLPAVVEVEVTPFGQKQDIMEFCLDNNVIVLNNNCRAKDIYSHRHDLVSIAERVNLTPQQLLIKWSLTKGYCTLLPASEKHDYRALCEMLPKYIMDELDRLDEALTTSWEISDEIGDD